MIKTQKLLKRIYEDPKLKEIQLPSQCRHVYLITFFPQDA